MIQTAPLDLSGWKHADRFWEYTIPEPNTGCWLWMGNVGRWGYGHLRWGRYDLRAHRAAYALAVGPIPRHSLVCHRCDVRVCCNPAHLFLGTPKDNSDDMVRKGRRSLAFEVHRSGEENPRARLTETQVRDIKRMLNDGATGTALSAQFGVGTTQIYRIKSGERWAHVV